MEFTGERYIPNDDMMDELSVEHLHRYYSILPLIKDQSVLDIACGEGYGTALMANTANNVVGIDISNECVSHAAKKYLSHYSNIRFLQGEAESIPLSDELFDVVVSFETLEHISAEGQKKFVTEVKRVLKKNGVFIVSTPDKENYSDRYSHENQFHIHELTRPEFKGLIFTYFSNALMMEQGFEIVSAIAPTDETFLESLRLIKWKNNPTPKKRKYLIAIASDKPLHAMETASVVLETDKDYFKYTDRIIELQNALEDRTSWALQLDKERIQQDVVIQTLKEQLQAYGHQRQQDIQHLAEKITLLHQWMATKNTSEGTVHQPVNALEAEMLELKKKYVIQKEELLRADVLKSEYGRLEEQLDLLTNDVNEKVKDLKKKETDITDLEKALVEKEKQIESLEKANNDQEKIIADQVKAIQKHNKIISDQGKAIHNQDKVVKNQENILSEQERLIQDLQFNFTLTQKQLSEVNEKLVTIYGSDGWKMLERYYRLKGRLMPEESKQYIFLKKALNLIRSKEVVITAVGAENNTPEEEYIVVEKITLPYFQQPLVSIIIPVYNAWRMNAKCVQSIFEHTKDVAYEIIIADDCSNDETRNISDYFTNIMHIRNEKNLGFLKNCNHAATKARGQYLHFLNNDTEVSAGWLSSLVKILENDSSAGLVGSKLIYPDGNLQEAGGIIWNDASGWNFGHKQNPDAPEFNYVKEVDYISGASIMIPKKLWNEIGGFDERYTPAYYEDSDLAFEVRKRGYKVIYQPLSEIFHYEGYSHGSDTQKSKISSIKEYQRINNKRFFEKWKSTLQKDQFQNAENVFWAKDRSRNKKTILMVDHYVPQFDKDAGSRTTFQYLKLFVKLGYNVKFLGENFYKHEPYTTILQQMGIEVLYGSWYANNWQQWFKENKEKFDYIYLNRPHISIKFIDFFKNNSEAAILYYGHDLHFLREQKRYEIEKDPRILEEAANWKKTENYLFTNSDVILTPSKEEQLMIKEMNSDFNVQLMRPYIYEYVHDPVTDFETRKNILFVGGFGHTPNVDAVLWFTQNIWPVLQKKLKGIQFIIAGSNPPAEIKTLSSEDILVKGFVSDAELEALYKTCKLSVIPLRYGAGVKGKTVEAMQHGLPFVTTDFGVEGLPGDYSFVPVANTTTTFANSTLEIYNNHKTLRYLSEKGVNYIHDNFSEKVAKETILQAMQTINNKIIYNHYK